MRSCAASWPWASRSVERLRFRVGTIRAARGTAGRRLVRSTPGPAASGKPHTATEAVARFRAVVERRRNAHRAAGGAFCASCGGAIAAGPGSACCRPCADARERDVREQCERILFEAPWLDPETVINAVPGLGADAYDRIRRRLLRAWVDELRLARKRHAVKAEIDRVARPQIGEFLRFARDADRPQPARTGLARTPQRAGRLIRLHPRGRNGKFGPPVSKLSNPECKITQEIKSRSCRGSKPSGNVRACTSGTPRSAASTSWCTRSSTTRSTRRWPGSQARSTSSSTRTARCRSRTTAAGFRSTCMPRSRCRPSRSR